MALGGKSPTGTPLIGSQSFCMATPTEWNSLTIHLHDQTLGERQYRPDRLLYSVRHFGTLSQLSGQYRPQSEVSSVRRTLRD